MLIERARWFYRTLYTLQIPKVAVPTRKIISQSSSLTFNEHIANDRCDHLVKIEQQNGHLAEEFMLSLIRRCKKDEERRDKASKLFDKNAVSDIS